MKLNGDDILFESIDENENILSYCVNNDDRVSTLLSKNSGAS